MRRNPSHSHDLEICIFYSLQAFCVISLASKFIRDFGQIFLPTLTCKTDPNCSIQIHLIC